MKYWVFDLDGTLIDSHGAYFSTLYSAFEQHGAKFTENDMQEILRISSKDRAGFFAKKLGAHNVQSVMDTIAKKIRAAHTTISPFHGVHELLSSLQSEEATIAVWTARERDSAIYALEKLDLHKYISLCVGGTCVTNCKPNPEGLLKIAKEFCCNPEDLIMVGDHDNDMNAAKNCGAKAIRSTWHKPNTSLEKCTISDLQFAEVAEILHWVRDK